MRFRAVLLSLLAIALLPAAARGADAPAGFQGGPGHPGAVDAEVAPPLGKRWVRKDLGRPSTPILHDGRVLVTATRDAGLSSSSSALHALDAATGATLWSVPGVGGRVSASGDLVFTRVGEEIVARDAGSGAVRWTASGFDDSNLNEPVADGDLVFLGGPGITALRVADGSEAFTTRSENARTGLPAADGERAYVLGCGGGVLSVRRSLGLTEWKRAGDCGGGSSPVEAVVAQDRVWGERSVHRASDGAALGTWAGPPPSVAGDRTVVADGSALRARDFEGRALWEATAPPDSFDGSALYGTRPLIAGSTVFAATPSGIAFAHDLATGRELWRSTTRVEEFASTGSLDLGIAARGDRLVVPFPDRLVAYGPGADTPGVDPDPWLDPSAISLSLGKPAKARLTFGAGTSLTAEYARTVGRDTDGAKLVLEADPFPFGSWDALRPVEADELDRGIGVRPDRNTRYRLRADGVRPAKHSEERQVDVDVAFRVRYRFLSRRRVRARVTLRAPADRLSPARLRVPFYFYRRATDRSVRIAVKRLRRTSQTSATGVVLLRSPRPFARRDLVFACLPEKADDGFGRFQAAQRGCGRRRL